MAQGDSPAVARRRVRLALREAREARDLTQSQVADAMEWSLSKVMRIESGEVAIAPNDLKPLLVYLQVTEAAVVSGLLDDARLAKRRRLWSDEPRYRENLTPAMRQLIQYEVEAPAVRHFTVMIIPGRLQTPAYAEAILNSYRSELSDDIVQVRLETRLRRRNELQARKTALEIFLLLDESVLHREVGGPKVMGDQLAYLLKLAKDAKLVMRVLPFTEAAPLALLGPFDIFDLTGHGDAIMYRESHLFDEIVEDPTKVKWHRELFEQMWNVALDETTSARLIEGRVTATLETKAKPPG